MSDLPRDVVIHEEGPREGFQSATRVFPTADKLRLIDALSATGLREIQCASFVNPKQVPQMADAEELAGALVRQPGIRYTGLWLNERGFERALASGIDLNPIVISSASNTFALKNNGCDSAELMRRQVRMIEMYLARGIVPRAAYVFTAFGCHYEGMINPRQAVDAAAGLMAVCEDFGVKPEVIYFCDTVGVANPAQVEAVIGMARCRWPDQTLALHLHDTRGMALANAYSALKLGVAQFDASCGGLGGCPFAGTPDAPGNVCTEDLAFMCEEMGISTGLDLERLCECAQLAERILGQRLPGRLMRSGFKSGGRMH